ncbi:NAD(+) synthase [Ornithinibacillus gellani]|uniref:NAD(+) synthase n=1 Tax=Ornithinibacillus gellani TaxID=2293253 RepID=UPI000F4AB4C6|nr:NAD(+) synthase [Ornithinibacillus gellani]TQS74673.1 NAD(+) synthase [Ornithinibacillus gellani]
MEKHVDEIVKWIQEQVKQAGCNGAIVGVSGGLDSAVVAFLIKRAFPDHSVGVMMPLNSNPRDMVHAKQVIETSGITGLTIDLTDTHRTLWETLESELGDTFQQDAARLTNANLRARLRMSTLYAIASNHHYLVVGTDNASEWYTGYFTKYGDGGVDILPLVDFTKQEVREMAAYLGVPEEVIHKNPSADLWEGQTDENEMGTTYTMIDAYVKGQKIPEKDKDIIERMHRVSEHKRNPLPQYRR